MKFSGYPFVRYFLFWSIGILSADFIHFYALASYWPMLFLCLFLAISFWLKKADFTRNLRGISSLLLLTWAGNVAVHRQSIAMMPNHFSKQTFKDYQVNISSNPERKPNSYKVEAEVIATRQDSKWKVSSGKILLYFRNEDGFVPKYGDWLIVRENPRDVEGPKNPEEFDYQRFQAKKNIVSHDFLRQKDYVLLGNRPQNWLLNWAFSMNRYADSVYKQQLKDPNAHAIASAMVLGVRDQIDNDLLKAYSASGAVHVLSVSGMHVAILFVVLSFLLKLIPPLKRNEKLFSIIILLILWFYAIFTGLSVTVIRATIMFSFIQIGRAFGRKVHILNTLAVSALFLLIWNPNWLFDVGFQLSYLAIIGIVQIHPILNQVFNPKNFILRKLWEISSVAFSAQLLTFPLSIYYFHQFPTYFLAANPFVFLFSEGILPLGLLLLFVGKIPYLSDLVAFLLEWSVKLLNYSVQFIEAFPLAILKGFSISKTETIVLYAVMVCVFLFFRYVNFKWLLGATFMLFGLAGWNIFETLQQNKQQSLTFHFIPRGAGISLIQGKNATFFSDKKLIENPKIYDFHLKNYYDKLGIKNKKFIEPDSIMTTIDYHGQKICWLKRFPGSIDAIPESDFLLVSNGALRYIQHKIPIKTIIVDDSNRLYVVNRLRHDADSLGIRFVSLYESGAITIQ
jgi:competence protein ComEC